MKREQKFGLIGLTIASFFVVSPFFQNCAKVSYDLNALNSGLNTPSGTTGRKVTIDPTYNQQKANLKVLFVVDDSYTMSQSQSQLANALSSLLNPLQGHNVQFKVVSTSGVPSNQVDYALTTKYMNESRQEITQSQAQALSSYLIQKSAANTSTRHSTLELFRNSTTAQFNTLKSQLSNVITAAGVNGSDTEEGICATARQLFDNTSSSFFKQGDKAAIVILTDENDSSVFSKCVTRYIQRVSTAPVVYYSYGQQRAKLTLEYQLTKDGVPAWYPVVWGIALTGPRTITNGTTCSSTDQSAALNYITSQGYVIRNVSSCVYETVPASYYGSDLGDNGSNPGLNLCASPVTYNNVTYPNLYDLINVVKSAQAGSCVKQVLPSNSLSPYIEYDSVISSDTVSSNAQNLSTAIKNKAVSLFGSTGFTVASLIRRYGENCNLNAGQSYGTAYEALASLLGSNNSVTQSLCGGDFSGALSQVSNFIVTEVNSSYVISPLASNEYISGVAVKRAGVTNTLSSSQYTVVGNTVTLTGFTLQSGDVIEVTVSTN